VKKTNLATVELISSLPKSTRAKLNLVDLQLIQGAAVIKELIQSHFKMCAASEAELRRAKSKHGYCAGKVTCMVRLGSGGKYLACDACRAYFRKIGSGDWAASRRKNGHSEYGLIRKKEKEAERVEREVATAKEAAKVEARETRGSMGARAR
jgi:hypothetical protein